MSSQRIDGRVMRKKLHVPRPAFPALRESRLIGTGSRNDRHAGLTCGTPLSCFQTLPLERMSSE